MPYIRATDRAVYWAVGDPIVASGITEAGGLTLTGLTLVADPDDNAYMLALAGTSAPAMPPAGTELAQGAIYDYGGTTYMVRQDHTRTEHDPATIPALFTTYRADAGQALDWVIGEHVYIGTRRIYNGVLYACLQEHQTQSDQTPPAAGIIGVLWGVVALTPDWAVGVVYTGDNTAGAGNGDVVTYEGATYRCLQSHTSIVTWYPTAVGIINVLWVLVA